MIQKNGAFKFAHSDGAINRDKKTRFKGKIKKICKILIKYDRLKLIIKQFWKFYRRDGVHPRPK